MTLLFVFCFALLVVSGAPLFVIVGAVTALCFAIWAPNVHDFSGLMQITQKIEQLLDKQEFIAIPLFIASGAVMTAGGIAKRLVAIMRAALGWIPGGLAISAVAACMFFAAISGSSPVTLIAVGSILFPAMIESKYPENFSLGLLTTAGSLGCLVPPSISMLIYAISIGSTSATVTPDDMFVAGLVPAIFIAGLLAVYAFFKGLQTKATREKFELAKLRVALREGIWALLLPVVILGGIYGGLYNPSEAGAVAMIYSLVVTMFVYRELSFVRLMSSLMEAATLMGTLLLIIVLTFGFNDFLALVNIPDKLMDLIRSMELGPFAFLLLVNVVLIFIGALMDSISCTLLFAPLFAPIAYDLYGIDPIHFGIVFVINMEIGYLMPPVATNLFVSAAVFQKPFGQVTRAVLPTLAITCVALAVVMYVPTVSKAAINLKRGKPLYEPFPWDGRPKPAVVGPTEVEAGVVAPPDSEENSAMAKMRKLRLKLDEEPDAGPEEE